MRSLRLHHWRVSPAEAMAIQRELAEKVVKKDDLGPVRYIAGTDISVARGSRMGRGAVVVLSYPGLELVEARTVEMEIDFPYVPGLLTFREAPVLLAAADKLSVTPDLILVDGQGVAHPRRLGLASHLGLLWDVPAIGCAKSRLCGSHDSVGETRGEVADLVDDGEVIGAVLRTKDRVKPLFISTGHKVRLSSAVEWALKCCRGYRLPEPTRLAHLAAGGNLK